jgi:Tfp pilus assembly protein PilX
MNHVNLPFDREDRAPGFALVVTISLLILLTLVAVGLLSLSAVSLRTTGQGAAKAQAQANARLAMMLAIGELQKQLGPDRAITAPSAIYDQNPVTEEPDGLDHRHLTGVWQARS